MKKIPFVLLFLFTLNTNGQALVTSDKLWSTMKGPVSGCSSFYCSSYFTKFVDDTVVGGILYLKVMRSEDQQMQKWTLEGFIREDNAQKVFYRDTHASNECLLYDFGIGVGNTLQLNCGCNKSDYLVDSIKTITVDNIPRKYFYLTYLDMKTPEIWIEGIGSTMGVLNAGGWGHCLTGGGMGEALLCFYEGGLKKYQSTEFPNYCYLSPEIIDGIAPEKTVSPFKVYPNPVSGELFIQSNLTIDETYILEIYSVKGELVKTECLQLGSNLHQISMSSLQNGIIILRLISDSGKYSEEVIVRE